jgi:GMP synthase-like glutamine amidotransferase
VRLLVLDVNVIAGGSTGCLAIAERLANLEPDVQVEHGHWRDHTTYREVTSPAPDAFVLGPNTTPFPAYPEDFSEFLAWVRDYQGALLGICGGHQVLALAHGATVAPAHDVPPATTSYQGLPKLKGPTRITVEHTAHPLLLGLPSVVTLTASHVDEVRALPANFERLARGEACAIQIMGHLTRPQFGIQCHPERPSDDADGGRILRNWLTLIKATI